MQCNLLTFAFVKLLVFAPLFNTPQKKHVLNYFAHEMAAIIVSWRSHSRECVVEGRGFFPHVFIDLECQKSTLSEHIVFHAILFLICFRK